MIDQGEADAVDRLVATGRTSSTHEVEHGGAEETTAIMVETPITDGETREFGQKAEGSMSDGDRAGEALRKVVFDPLRSPLAGRTWLFLSPDGDVTRLPFEVLSLANGHRPIEDY